MVLFIDVSLKSKPSVFQKFADNKKKHAKLHYIKVKMSDVYTSKKEKKANIPGSFGNRGNLQNQKTSRLDLKFVEQRNFLKA